MSHHALTSATENLDRMLDELEDLSRSAMPGEKFLAMVVERLRLTLSAQLVRLVMLADADQCLTLASSGDPQRSVEVEQTLTDFLRRPGALQRPSLRGHLIDGTWIAVPLRPSDFAKGCLLVITPVPIPEHALDGMVELMSAFAEVIHLRQHVELETFLDTIWDQAQATCMQISSACSQDNAATLVVGALTRILGAARVSLLQATAFSFPRVVAVSGVPKVNSASSVLPTLQSLGRELQQCGKPILRQSPSEQSTPGEMFHDVSADGCFSNLLALRFASGPASRASPANQRNSTNSRVLPTWLVIEYPNQAEMIRHAPRLPQVLPTIAVSWEQQSRWLHVPKIARVLALGPIPALRASLRLLKWPMLVVVLLACAWALQRPYPLVIEAEGSYEPVVSRAIYASDDGFVDGILVDDEQWVKVGEPLVQLRSPGLELRIEQVNGELRGVLEESSGIRIAINQLDPDAPDMLNNQSRLAGKIAELETQQESLSRQLSFLQEQAQSLLIHSPIQGRVVAKDLQRHLAGRPVRRGDPLFSIVDQSGAWQVRVHVADRDVGYLRAHFTAEESKPDQAEGGNEQVEGGNEQVDRTRLASDLTFTLASNPAQRWPATIHWISEHVENLHGEGCFVEVRATVDDAPRIGAHAGAGVHAFFPCGEQPLWFVWSRPLVETIQRKFWLRTPSGE